MLGLAIIGRKLVVIGLEHGQHATEVHPLGHRPARMRIRPAKATVVADTAKGGASSPSSSRSALIITPAVASSDSILARSASEEGVSNCSISSLARRAGVPEL